MRLTPRAIIFLSYVLFCVVLTHLPPPAVPRVSLPGVDKLVHFFLYFGMGILVMGAWQLPKPMLLRVFLGLLLFAAIDEITQIPFGRTADVFDWGCDALGARVGLWLSTR